jgi:hypothetical protein
MADRRLWSRPDSLSTAGAAMAIAPVGSAAVTADEGDPASVSLGSAQSKPYMLRASFGSTDATFGEEMSSRPRSFRRLRLPNQRTPSRGDGSGNRMLLIR